ncbi:MAG: hypothetical protein KGL39_31210 [Patescibacteria group bacterium]|nr:hypothetical protein [Patescibacteria group bacterium]
MSERLTIRALRDSMKPVLVKPSVVPMTEDGYRNRMAAVEWHANWWLQSGVPRSTCEAMLRHCSECVEADFQRVPRPDARQLPMFAHAHWAQVMERFLDRLFASKNNMVSYD